MLSAVASHADASSVASVPQPHTMIQSGLKPKVSAFDMIYKSKPAQGFDSRRELRIADINQRFQTSNSRFGKSAPATVSPVALPASDQFNYLTCADGSTWFYTADFEIEEIPENEYYSRKVYRGYTFNIYNSKLELVGTIKDKTEIDAAAGETGIAQLELVPIITKKFFNADDKYEVMVAWVVNTAEYNNKYFSHVYSLNGKTDADGNSIRICKLDGIVSDFINAAADPWSEDVYMTCVKDLFEFDDPNINQDNASYVEFMNAYKMGFEIYKKAGYGSSPKLIFNKKINLNRLSGDGQYDVPFFSTLNKDGKVRFVFAQYAQDFYNDIEDPMNPSEDISMREGNNLIIEVYNNIGNTCSLVQTTTIPVVKNTASDNVLFTYYALGSMRYAKDIVHGASDGETSFYITKKDYLISDDDAYNYTFTHYDAKGNLTQTLATDVMDGLEVSDVNGYAEQFAVLAAIEDGYEFNILDMENGMPVVTLPVLYEVGTRHIEQITANFDRVPSADGYNYAVELRKPGLSGDNEDLMRIMWLDSNGDFLRIDEVNMGKGIALAQSYIDAAALNPYVFNTDSELEYMLLVKRYNEDATNITEELIIAQPLSDTNRSGKTVLSVLPNDEKGSLAGIYPLDFNTNPTLLVSYFNESTNQFYQEFYKLPLSKFAGGDGTAENPYHIATIGDLARISDDLAAHYVLDNDIDATAYAFYSIGKDSEAFTGTLDGQGHTISNLDLTRSTGIFYQLTKASVSNLNIRNAVCSVANNNTGVLASSATDSKITNVHVVGLTAQGATDKSGSFGGLVAAATNHSEVTACSVVNAAIAMPGNNDFNAVGGVVGTLKTGSKIAACTFTGQITDGVNIGGIVGTASTGDELISDCHVNATLKGKNGIGGIAGNLEKRANVVRCYFEGSLEATAPEKWGAGYKMGGIVGYLAPSYTVIPTEDGTTPAPTACVSACIANLSAMTTSGANANPSSAHRIVGWTSNDAAKEIDWDNTTDPNNPVYLPTTPERGIEMCYAIGTVTPENANENPSAKSREGATKDQYEVDAEWLATLGYKFGDNAENPWTHKFASDFSLWHEYKARIDGSGVYNVESQTEFDVDILLVSAANLSAEEVAEGLSFESSDEEVATLSGKMSCADHVFSLGILAGKVGDATLTINLLDTALTAEVHVKAGATGAVDAEIVNVLAYTGGSVIADGRIRVYDIAGKAVAHGLNRVDVGQLQPGVYVATAHGQTLKFVIR